MGGILRPFPIHINEGAWPWKNNEGVNFAVSVQGGIQMPVARDLAIPVLYRQYVEYVQTLGFPLVDEQLLSGVCDTEQLP